MEELNKAVDELIHFIQNTEAYKNCRLYQEQMNQNDEIMRLVKEIKTTQKMYVKSNYDSSLEENLKSLEEELHRIPLYVSYNQELEKVNFMIDFVKDTFNQYFDQLLNKKN